MHGIPLVLRELHDKHLNKSSIGILLLEKVHIILHSAVEIEKKKHK